MKLVIQKSFEFVVNTAYERARIEKAFKKDNVTRGKLTLLMDLIEAGFWQGAKAELEGEWWNGRDKRLECPRLEFIGLVKCNHPHIDRWMSYRELVYAIDDSPDMYKLIRKV